MSSLKVMKTKTGDVTKALEGPDWHPQGEKIEKRDGGSGPP